ncbi:dioxygenase family protein [Ferrimonas marina]|uniref:Protocatechuate 3,4-dioxygenase beta subunit n=1 Tax=Ferrimonas marina TaxID=299255 RepID=A0A1M5Z572_9GAMM|nr:hypothetical protein [Ferrimonas marina]SHI19402.1 Protocatechuate 3,4-dioxygenase beta subunit [Ferrimonas marina]
MKRRSVMALGAIAAGAGGLWWQKSSLASWVLNQGLAITPAPIQTTAECVLTPEQSAGPFYFRSPDRQDIREGKAGLPLNLTIQVVDVDQCTPVADAVVEIWHCDADGQYSGYTEADRQGPERAAFLRGGQISDTQGMVKFVTVFPGWYTSRVTHIHAKVHAQGQSYLTTQLYFPDPLVNDIYQAHPAYTARGASPHSLSTDMLLSRYRNGTGLLLEPEGSIEGMTANIRLGVRAG